MLPSRSVSFANRAAEGEKFGVFAAIPAMGLEGLASPGLGAAGGAGTARNGSGKRLSPNAEAQHEEEATADTAA